MDSVQAEFREPWVEHFHSFFSKEDCHDIIQAAEEYGFPNDADSIDYLEPRSSVSWAIDVYVEESLEVPKIASLYEKYLPKLRDVVADRKFQMNHGDTSEPSLDWVFLRKYKAGAERRMLKLHHDTNLFTVNVALNDDYQGGGLFYHKNDDSYFYEDDEIPLLPDDILNYDYLETVRRKNTSAIVFPNLQTGDFIIHNHTLWHAIAPIEVGTRYSLVFFYDIHHPHVRRFLTEDIDVTIENYFPEDQIVDLYAFDHTTYDNALKLYHANLPEKIVLELTTNEQYLIVDRTTQDVLDEFIISTPDDYFDEEEYDEEYVIQIGIDNDDEDEDDDDDDDDDEYEKDSGDAEGKEL